MSGIVFYKTKSLEQLHEFYHNTIGMSLWLDQGNCRIYQLGNLLLGFIESNESEKESIITFFLENQSDVDSFYKIFKNSAVSEPEINPKFNIYHFFTKDPENRKIEFQVFLHKLKPFKTNDEILTERRSIRVYTAEHVSDNILAKIFESCRYSPTSRNSQSFYYIIIREKEKIEWLSQVRGSSSGPLKTAPVNILVCSDSSKTSRPEQDACIAATYLMLSAYNNGLGTCWVTDMNRTEVKNLFNIPKEDYIACATPIGFPGETKTKPAKREIKDFVFLNRKE